MSARIAQKARDYNILDCMVRLCMLSLLIDISLFVLFTRSWWRSFVNPLGSFVKLAPSLIKSDLTIIINIIQQLKMILRKVNIPLL